MKLAVIAAALLGAACAAWLWPVQYRAEAELVPSPAMPPRGNALADRLRPLRRAILAHPILVNVIQNQDLYAGERKRMPMEDAVALMRKAVSLETGFAEGTQSLTISFTATDPDAAIRGCRDLTERLIAEDRELTRSEAVYPMSHLVVIRPPQNTRFFWRPAL